jgi:hypothetical protein
VLLSTFISLYSDIEMLFAETAATQTVERPVRHDPISESNNTIFFNIIQFAFIFLR